MEIDQSNEYGQEEALKLYTDTTRTGDQVAVLLEKVFRSAISLSNTGADLLEKGAYDDGTRAMLDSMSVLQKLFAIDASNISPDLPQQWLQDIETKRRDANRLLSEATAETSSSVFTNAVDLSLHAMSFSSIQNLLERTAFYHFETMVLTPIRLTKFEAISPNFEGVADFVSSVILFNCGLTYLVRSQLNLCEMNAKQTPQSMVGTAFRLFQYAITLVRSCYDAKLLTHRFEQAASLQKVALLHFVTGCILRTWRDAAATTLHNEIEAAARARALTDIQLEASNMLKDIQTTWGVPRRDRASAA